ncbi:hypothetical protein CHY_0353 [Calderihabitans maritimus]|uniref:Uncharacterized protein n=1 Tax=Calderihabitans maritimus TaxID=1246530 RepID=A0A1Z5HQ68_9FIRM|nr:hypothetical protein CHY_0353 [Calderihabitans maritimus]
MGKLENLRCKCGKIVCQFEGNTVVIKCRHCKRFIIISTKGFVSDHKGLRKIEYK